jgi:signal transduction histidine kinase
MSHELRTPLNAIMGYNDLVLEGAFGDLKKDQREPLRRVAKSATELLELINTTLDVSRIEAGRLPVDMKEFGLADLLSQIQLETQDLQAKPGVRFHWNLAPALPRLHSDPMKLKVVLKNLIANAVKFTEHGSVTVEAHRQDGGVEIAVADTGIGIPAEARSLIFEPFRQADSSTTRRYGGVGLGLYIVRRLIEMLGGTVTVDSETGHGSTFRVWVPANGVNPAAQVRRQTPNRHAQSRA